MGTLFALNHSTALYNTAGGACHHLLINIAVRVVGRLWVALLCYAGLGPRGLWFTAGRRETERERWREIEKGMDEERLRMMERD